MCGKTTVGIPRNFWNDHIERHPYEDGAKPPRVVASNGDVIRIERTDPGLPHLRSDAAYYADPSSMDECPRWLRDSAKRALAAIDCPCRA